MDFTVLNPYLFDLNIDFTLANIKEYINKELGNVTPNLIVGISMGGLILPHIATNYPQAKLVFVASGTKIGSGSETFNKLLKFEQSKVGKLVLSLLQLSPILMMQIVYKTINPFKGAKEDKEKYDKDMQDNIYWMKRITVKRHLEIIELVCSLNTENIVKKLPNKVLIMYGQNDVLMPKNESKILSNTLHNSVLKNIRAEHFNVINQETLEYIKEFVND